MDPYLSPAPLSTVKVWRRLPPSSLRKSHPLPPCMELDSFPCFPETSLSSLFLVPL